jgi:hypothetical protein
LINRKKKLNAFLSKRHGLMLDDFLRADPAIFRQAEEQLSEWRAKHINPYHVAGMQEDSED